MAEEKMKAARSAFLLALKTARTEPNEWEVVRSTLDTAYELGRLRCLHPSLAKAPWPNDDINILKTEFPKAIKVIQSCYDPLTGSMNLEDVYVALKYCSALKFIQDDFKPLFVDSKPDSGVLKSVEEDWNEAWKMHKLLMHYMTFEWPLQWRHEKPDLDEKPNLEGVPPDHVWWVDVVALL